MNQLKWHKVGNPIDNEVLAINDCMDMLIGTLNIVDDQWICEDDFTALLNVKYYVSIEELNKTLPSDMQTDEVKA